MSWAEKLNEEKAISPQQKRAFQNWKKSQKLEKQRIRLPRRIRKQKTLLSKIESAIHRWLKEIKSLVAALNPKFYHFSTKSITEKELGECAEELSQRAMKNIKESDLHISEQISNLWMKSIEEGVALEQQITALGNLADAKEQLHKEIAAFEETIQFYPESAQEKLEDAIRALKSQEKTMEELEENWTSKETFQKIMSGFEQVLKPPNPSEDFDEGKQFMQVIAQPNLLGHVKVMEATIHLQAEAADLVKREIVKTLAENSDEVEGSIEGFVELIERDPLPTIKTLVHAVPDPKEFEAVTLPVDPTEGLKGVAAAYFVKAEDQLANLRKVKKLLDELQTSGKISEENYQKLIPTVEESIKRLEMTVERQEKENAEKQVASMFEDCSPASLREQLSMDLPLLLASEKIMDLLDSVEEAHPQTLQLLYHQCEFNKDSGGDEVAKILDSDAIRWQRNFLDTLAKEDLGENRQQNIEARVEYEQLLRDLLFPYFW